MKQTAEIRPSWLKLNRILLVFLSLMFLSAGKLSSGPELHKTSCSYTICVQNGSGTPASGHNYHIEQGGVTIYSGTLDANGCVTVTLDDNKTYWLCDDSAPCTHNCAQFTVNCLGTGVMLTIC